MEDCYFYKERLEYSLRLLQAFREKAMVEGIRYELDSIEKFYKAELYNLRDLK